MDWGFDTVEGLDGAEHGIACFAMVCHHCGTPYIEFFPNAKQENLFIGMLHTFMRMGIPDWILTDNMKSVVTAHSMDGQPICKRDYASFMESVGFRARLCRPRHPFTKGKVERLIRFVKENFLAGRGFTDITSLNEEAEEWCTAQAGRWRKAAGCVPADEHRDACMARARTLGAAPEIDMWLCPKRRMFLIASKLRFGGGTGNPYHPLLVTSY